MKFIFAIALLCIGAVAAQTQAPHPNGQNPNHALVESLEKRAAALLVRVQQEQQKHRFDGGHLLQAIDRQAVLVEALALDLKTQLAHPPTNGFQLHHIHVIEEDLLNLENRVSEEIEIVEHVHNGHHNPNPSETPAQLIARGQQLVKQAQAAVTAHPQAKEVKEIQSEIIVVEALVKAIQAKPAPSAAELKKDQDELARQEKTLQQLIEKANHRQPHH